MLALTTSWFVALILILWIPAVARAQTGGWSTPIDITQPSDAHHTQYGVIACDPFQHAHVFWGDNVDSGEATPAIYHRTDIAGEWSTPNEVVVGFQSITKLRVAVSERFGSIHLLWMNRALNSEVYLSSAPLAQAPDAKAWSSPALLFDRANSAAFQIDQTGIMHAAYSQASPDGLQQPIFYLRSEDDGASWSTPERVSELSLSVPSVAQIEMALDGRGRVHLGISLRSYEYGVEDVVGYLRSIDDGDTWSEFKLIQDTGTTSQGVAWIAPYAFGEDEVFLTWHDPRRMFQRSTDGGETWSSPTEVFPLNAAFGGANPIAQDSSGQLHIVLASGGAVYVLDWGGNAWVAPQRIEDRLLDPHGQQIAVCQGNQLHVVYYDNYQEPKGGLVDAQNRVWWASRQLSSPWHAPEVAPVTGLSSTAAEVIPAPTEMVPSIATPSLFDEAAGSDLSSTQSEARPTEYDMARSLLISVIPVILLILGVVIFKRRPSHGESK